MSRVIKFRAWLTGDETMMKPFDIVSMSLEKPHRLVLPNDILMQYTGLKDKNGVEIYEGDLVKISQLYLDNDWSKTLEVRYASNGYHLYKQDTIGWEATLSRYEEKFKMEVIGNIHENPELLT